MRCSCDREKFEADCKSRNRGHEFRPVTEVALLAGEAVVMR